MSPTKQKPGLSPEEKAALKATLRERKLNEDGEKAVAEALKKMAPADRAIGRRVHELVKAAAPHLTPRTWYGMPAYANADGKVVCFFKDSGKFKARYSEFGFNEAANLDEGSMWPIVYAITTFSKADEARVTALVKQAVA